MVLPHWQQHDSLCCAPISGAGSHAPTSRMAVRPCAESPQAPMVTAGPQPAPAHALKMSPVDQSYDRLPRPKVTVCMCTAQPCLSCAFQQAIAVHQPAEQPCAHARRGVGNSSTAPSSWAGQEHLPAPTACPAWKVPVLQHTAGSRRPFCKTSARASGLAGKCWATWRGHKRRCHTCGCG